MRNQKKKPLPVRQTLRAAESISIGIAHTSNCIVSSVALFFKGGAYNG